MLIDPEAVERFCKERGRQPSDEFVAGLDQHIEMLLRRSCKQFNGHKKKMPVEILIKAANFGL